MIGYIDDIHLNRNLTVSNKSIDYLRNDLNKSIAIWEELLCSTGGELSNTKCIYNITKWIQDRHTMTQMTIDELSTTLINPLYTKIHECQQIEYNNAYRYLGIRISPSGKWKQNMNLENNNQCLSLLAYFKLP